MDLETLPGSRDITPAEFRTLFALRLDPARLERAARVVAVLQPSFTYSVGNVLHMALQKDTKAQLEHETVDRVLAALEHWAKLVQKAPNQVVAAVDTRQFFDILYAEYFLNVGDSLPGLGGITSDSVRSVRSESKLWIPASAR